MCFNLLQLSNKIEVLCPAGDVGGVCTPGEVLGDVDPQKLEGGDFLQLLSVYGFWSSGHPPSPNEIHHSLLGLLAVKGDIVFGAPLVRASLVEMLSFYGVQSLQSSPQEWAPWWRHAGTTAPVKVRVNMSVRISGEHSMGAIGSRFRISGVKFLLLLNMWFRNFVSCLENADEFCEFSCFKQFQVWL